mmetsp:Transcript_34043/g.113616  ORF Transcript_34043/g.113616 Transcript_34043/m.113616 type:complete len:373 (-) Transcript_34043:1362-2480(-)
MHMPRRETENLLPRFHLHHDDLPPLPLDLESPARGLQEGEGREEDLRLRGEGGEPREVGPAVNEARRPHLEQQRARRERVAHRHPDGRRRRHRRQLRPSRLEEAARRLDVLQPAPQVDRRRRALRLGLDCAQHRDGLADEVDRDGEGVRPPVGRRVPQRRVERPERGSGVEAEGEDVRQLQLGGTRGRVAHEVVEPHPPPVGRPAAGQQLAAGVAVALEVAVVKREVRGARSHGEAVVQALAVAGRAARLELGGDGGHALRVGRHRELELVDPHVKVDPESRVLWLASHQLGRLARETTHRLLLRPRLHRRLQAPRDLGADRDCPPVLALGEHVAVERAGAARELEQQVERHDDLWDAEADEEDPEAGGVEV